MGREGKIRFINNKLVRVTDPYYDKALELDVYNMLRLDADKLLAGFRETAGRIASLDDEEIKKLMKNESRYEGGWENSLIGGHSLGHYLTAIIQAQVNPGLDGETKNLVKIRADYIVDSLYKCQKMTENTEYEGYIFGAELNGNYDNIDFQFDNVERGLSKIDTQAWVPWYTMHKILAGLVDAYMLAGNKKALKVANGLGKWISDRVNGWSKETQNIVLGIEYGGMNDVLYDLYGANKKAEKSEKDKDAGVDKQQNEKFLRAAHQFDEVDLFERVLSGEKNVLNGKHANTTIPKFLGAFNRYDKTGQEKYLEYAKKFWDMVVENHTYITGGNSEDEHFGADKNLNSERTNANNETCNTYNMLKLSRKLFCATFEKKYADYYENTFINAIMSSQNHADGLTMYFQPMATGYYKIFGSLEHSFWCCTGTGYENFTKLQDSIYFVDDKNIFVNLYLASVIFDDDKYKSKYLEQTGDLLKSDIMEFRVKPEKDLYLRIPDWIREEKIGIKPTGISKVENGFLHIYASKLKEIEKDGFARFAIKLPMEVRAFNLPDAPDTYAFKYGPFVLSAGLGVENKISGSHGVAVKVPVKKAVKNDSIGILARDSVLDFIGNINEYLEKKEGAMEFSLKGCNKDLFFTPHFMQDTESYGIYWSYFVDADGKSANSLLAEKNESRLEKRLVSKMEQAGRGQYEQQFLLLDGTKTGLICNDEETIADTDKLTRFALENGSFTYILEAKENEDNYLLLTLAKEDDGKSLQIRLGQDLLGNETLDYEKYVEDKKVKNLTLAQADSMDYYQIAVKIDKEIVNKNIESLQVADQDGKEISKRVLKFTFSGRNGEKSARVCKTLEVYQPFSDENELQNLICDGQKLQRENDAYKLEIPYKKDEAQLEFELKDKAGFVKLNGIAVDEDKPKKIELTNAKSQFQIEVFAEDFESKKTYKLEVVKDYSDFEKDTKPYLIKAYNFDGDLDEAFFVTKGQNESIVKTEANPVFIKDGEINALALDGSCGLGLLENPAELGKSYTITYMMKANKIGRVFDPTLTAGAFSEAKWINMTFDGRMWSCYSGWISAEPSNIYEENKWFKVVLTVDGEKEGTAENTVIGSMYVNGEKIYQGNIAKDIMITKGSTLNFGINPWDEYFEGSLANVKIYKKAMNDSQVWGLFNSVG